MRIGYVIKLPSGSTVARVGEYVGQGTINVAEYYALIYALRHAIRLGFTSAQCTTDSQLMANQIAGAYEVKLDRMKRMLREVKSLARLIKLDVIWTRRDGNIEADELTHQTVYDVAEPPNPTPKKTGWITKSERKLPDWQGAFIRRWMELDSELEPVLARIFSVEITFIRQIARGLTYKNAQYTNVPNWSNYERPANSAGNEA